MSNSTTMWRILLLAAMVALLAACRTAADATPTPEPEPPTAVPVPTATSRAEAASLPDFSTLEAGWNQVKPAGSTGCATGTDFAFFVRPGDPQKLMVHLQGGGACWFGDICSVGDNQTYDASVSVDDNPGRAPFGLFDFENPENPVADYTMIYVPYCTGDVHLGDQVSTYETSSGESLEIDHNGFDNVSAALAWATANVDDPQTVFVNGSSAGAIPSPLYAALLADAYPDAHVVQLGDGAGGYRAPEAAAEVLGSWGTLPLLQERLGFGEVRGDSLTFEELYAIAAARHPEIRFAQYNTVEDETQRFFLNLLGRSDVALEPLLAANLTEVDAAVPDFASFTAGGDLHTILQRPEFYTYAADGVRFVTWVTALLDDLAAETVACRDCAAADEITAAEAAGMPDLVELPAGWSELQPYGDTTCSDGSDFSFFVRPGAPERLMIYFQGGGACWNQQTCSPAGFGIYDRDVTRRDSPEAAPFGIFALNNAENPVADYTMVFVPYCTGDGHLGNNTATYGAGGTEFTIEHRGFVNASAALEWTFANVNDPETVFVTGSSAGAIPSPFYARFAAEQYPAARIVQLGDAAGGYRVDDGADPLRQWGTLDVVRNYPEYAEVTENTLTFESLYMATGRRFPDVQLAQYNTANDQTQRLFLGLLGITDTPLLDLLLANYADVETAVPSFVSFTAGGAVHTILQRPDFYDVAVNGTRVRDWVADLLAGNPVESLQCVDCTVAEEANP